MSTAALDNILPLYFFGNYCIQNSRFRVSNFPRDSGIARIQSSKIARSSGRTVVNSSLDNRDIALKVQVSTVADNYTEVFNGQTAYTANYEDVRELKRIFSYNDRYLRVMPKSSYFVINRADSITGWSAANDATALYFDTDILGLDNGSIGTTLTSTASVPSQAVLITSNNKPFVYTTSIYPDLLDLGSNAKYRPSIEFIVTIPNDVELTSIGFRIGSSNLAYFYKTEITTNYEGKKLERGDNLISVPFDQLLTQGTPNMSLFGKYIQVLYQYIPQRTTYPSSQKGFNYGGMLLTLDSLIENYSCFRTERISFDDDAYEQKAGTGTVRLNNYTGIGRATHAEQLFNQAGITATTNIQTFEARGTLETVLPAIVVKLNSASTCYKIRLTDLEDELTYVDVFANNQSAAITFNNNDVIILDSEESKVTLNGIDTEFDNGALLEYKNGINRVKLDVFRTTDNIVTQVEADSVQSLTTNIFGIPEGALGQSFVAPITGFLSFAEVRVATAPVELNGRFTYLAQIRSDASGTPSNTVLTELVVYGDGNYEFKKVSYGFNTAVVSGTKYWLIFKRYGTTKYYNTAGRTPLSISCGNNAGPTGWALNRSTAAEADALWTLISTRAMTASLTFQATSTTNIDFSASATRLYN